MNNTNNAPVATKFIVYCAFNGDVYSRSRTLKGAEKSIAAWAKRLNSNHLCGDLARHLTIGPPGTNITPKNFNKRSFVLG